MFQSHPRRHPLFRVPFQTAIDEVQEVQVVAVLQHAPQILGSRGAAALALPRETARHDDRPVGHGRRGAVTRIALRTDKLSGPFRRFQQVRRRHAPQLEYAGQLVRLVLAWQQRETGNQLRDDAAQTPHVDRHPVFRPQDHLRRSVEPTLDVGVHPLVLVAARPEVYHLEEKNDRVR